MPFVAGGCATRYIEFEGECIIQQWQLASVTMRTRMLCDLPPPRWGETEVRDREAMDINPFPDLFEDNKADSTDPNLLEKGMGLPQKDHE